MIRLGHYRIFAVLFPVVDDVVIIVINTVQISFQKFQSGLKVRVPEHLIHELHIRGFISHRLDGILSIEFLFNQRILRLFILFVLIDFSKHYLLQLSDLT